MHLPTEALQRIQVMIWSTFVALQHLFMFQYQIKKEKYEKFLIQINQKKYYTFACLLKGKFHHNDMVKL